jgi:hypothetical protein
MTKNTVFIIGAGASKEANLPTGNELKTSIASYLDMRFDTFGSRLEHGDHKIVEVLHQLVRQPNGQRGDINPYLHEAWHIRDALPQAISIDNFIDAHRGNEKIALCGKLGIVRSILESEARSLLKVNVDRANPTINFKSLSNTWYVPFFQQLTENCGVEDLEERFQYLTLIIFNYDRCVEHYIYFALQNYYKVSAEVAANLVTRIRIIHPYGSVGTLPWIERNNSVQFGLDPHPEQLLQIASQIKTFTEGTDPDSSEIIEIRNVMAETDRLVFVGFAYHKLNMQLISPEQDSGENKSKINCYATTLGISASDKEFITEQIKSIYQRDIKIKMSDSTCGNFFNEYWRSLSF